jgi:hypothetical protein
LIFSPIVIAGNLLTDIIVPHLSENVNYKVSEEKENKYKNALDRNKKDSIIKFNSNKNVLAGLLQVVLVLRGNCLELL